MNLLSHLSHMTLNIHAKDQQQRKQVSWHSQWEEVWSRQKGCTCLGSSWAPAPQQCSSKAMEKAELQCRYQPVITPLEEFGTSLL